LSRDVICEEQQKDEVCAKYKHENFWVDEDGMLHYQNPKEQPRIVIPMTLVSTVLTYYHKLPFTAHQGVSRTLSFISRKFWWETMRNDVTKFIKECDDCARRKTGCKVKAPLGDVLVANEFLDIVSLDIVGPLPVTERGHRYLLTFVDHFTRFCEAIPIVRQDTETIAREFVVRIITQLGVPRKLLTDRGANFTSALLKETCRLLKIQKLQTSSYNPQANGICERMHKLLIDMISHFVRKDARNWDEYVPYAIMAYRAMPHCSTGYSPYYLVFGREMRLPIEDDWRPLVNSHIIKENEYEEHVKQLVERLREANKVAGQQSRTSHNNAKRYYDRQTKLQSFKKGDFVYVRDPTYKRGKAKKFSHRYKGPYAIEEKISSLIYKIRLDDGTFTIVHINRLKEAYGLKQGDIEAKNRTKRGKQVKKLDQTRNTVPKERPIEVIEPGRGIPSRTYLAEEETESVSEPDDEVEIEREHCNDIEWTPGSLHLRRKLRDDKTTDDTAYHLRSRVVSRSRPEPGSGTASTVANDEIGNDNTQDFTLSDAAQSTVGHSYNLRNRTGRMLTDTQVE